MSEAGTARGRTSSTMLPRPAPLGVRTVSARMVVPSSRARGSSDHLVVGPGGAPPGPDRPADRLHRREHRHVGFSPSLSAVRPSRLLSNAYGKANATCAGEWGIGGRSSQASRGCTLFEVRRVRRHEYESLTAKP